VMRKLMLQPGQRAPYSVTAGLQHAAPRARSRRG
jgi:hypothetical protein